MLTTTPSHISEHLPGQLPPDLVPEDVDLNRVAELALELWGNLNSDSLTEDVLWRDWMSLTGQTRTICGKPAVLAVWAATCSDKQAKNVIVKGKRTMRPCPNTSWVSVSISFETEQANGLKGSHSGTIALLPSGNEWKVWMLITILESFEGLGNPDNPQMLPPLQPPLLPDSTDYAVAIVGAGQGGLALAGRLKALNVPAVVIEKASSVGNAWTSKYDSLRQHTIKEYNNLPFDRTWKGDDEELLPGSKVAEGFGRYTQKYGLNVFLNTQITSCKRDDAAQCWKLSLNKVSSDTTESHVIYTRHLAIATGAGVGKPYVPSFNGRQHFKGTLMHQSGYRNGKKYAGKHAIIIGTGTSGHDIAQDCLDHGMDVTMIQRSNTAIYPIQWVVDSQKFLWNLNIDTGVSDRMGSTGPVKVACDIISRNMQAAAQKPENQEYFNNLEKAGFHVDRESGMLNLIFQRYGGYYIDIGTSQRIIDGSIKVKSGVTVHSFTKDGVVFSDGDELPADLVVAATGYEQDYRVQVAEIAGMEIAEQLPEFWGLDENGDIRGLMQEGRKGLWMIGGTAPMARWTSRFVALKMMLDILGIDNELHGKV